MKKYLWPAVLIFFVPFVLFFSISQTWGVWTGALIGGIGSAAFLLTNSKSPAASGQITCCPAWYFAPFVDLR